MVSTHHPCRWDSVNQLLWSVSIELLSSFFILPVTSQLEKWARIWEALRRGNLTAYHSIPGNTSVHFSWGKELVREQKPHVRDKHPHLPRLTRVIFSAVSSFMDADATNRTLPRCELPTAHFTSLWGQFCRVKKKKKLNYCSLCQFLILVRHSHLLGSFCSTGLCIWA